MSDKPLELHEAVVRQFLAEHPEHIQGVKRFPVDGSDEPELCLDTTTLMAFVGWTIETGRGDRHKARKFRRWLRDRIARGMK